jgi:DNA mismatch repair protein MSH5
MPRIMNLLRDGKGRVSEWQGLVKVRVPSIHNRLQISSTRQFTFHATMLRDALSELHQASQVDVISKVLSLHNFFLLPHIKTTPAH